MEKKAYIEPSMRVKAVNMLLMQALSDSEGGPDQFSKGIELPEEDNDGEIGGHDVWED